MKKFIRNIFIFFVPVIVYCFAAGVLMPYILSLQNGPSTEQQISYSFENSISRDYELLILGNSRTYRGLNPDEFTLRSFNFSHDNDSYNQIYYKLKYVLENGKKIRYLVLGVDYFQFSFKSDTRNYVYAARLGGDYIKDFTESNALLLNIAYYIGNINPKNLLSLKPKLNKPFLRANGQYIMHDIASESDTVKRDINRLDFQMMYFKKIIDLCRSKEIKTFIVMLPVRQNELKSYTASEMNEFNSFINRYTDRNNVFYLNYSSISDFTTSDYTDITHFNESAANRFSKMLERDMLKLINAEK